MPKIVSSIPKHRSLFPTACGVNPMLTIMGLAHFLARNGFAAR